MISEHLSSALIAVGQFLAILLFLLQDCSPRHSAAYRGGLCAAFLPLHIAIQVILHDYVTQNGTGSLPTIPYLLASLLCFLLFVFLWGHYRFSTCLFLSLIFLLVDNCVWPLISGVSRTLWGQSYLYGGALSHRLLSIFLLWGLEGALMLLIRRLLPHPDNIRLDRYTVPLTASILIPFLYIRSVTARSPSQDDKTMQIIVTLCCLSSLILLVCWVEQSLRQQSKLRAEETRNVLQRQQLQFQQKLGDIDAVNRKYHDIKNILLYLEQHNSTEELQRLRQELRPYEAQITSGNEAVDLILSEKLALCQEEHISCTPCIDGTLFSFVEPLDLCVLFGNAMDNAIEACRPIKESADRHISIRSVNRGGTAALTFRNTFATPPDLKRGLPSTTKADEQNHGYGLSNIQYIMEKYGGTLTCRLEGQEFVLTLLFPRREPTEHKKARSLS